MRSGKQAAARRLARLSVVVLLTAGPLAGCTSTQHEAQRVQLNSARGRAAALSTKVTQTNRLVKVTHIATVGGGGRTAFIVTVENSSARAVTDLPISVGYSVSGQARVYLNATAGLGYFEAHLPAVLGRHQRVWVYTASRPLPAGAQPFALVGPKPSVDARVTEPNVRIDVAGGWQVGSPTLNLNLHNPSSVPQYQLQVYRLRQARRPGRRGRQRDAHGSWCRLE